MNKHIKTILWLALVLLFLIIIKCYAAYEIEDDLYVSGDISLTDNTAGKILIANETNYNPVSLSGDATLDSVGDVTVTWANATEANSTGINWDDFLRQGEAGAVNWAEGTELNMIGINWSDLIHFTDWDGNTGINWSNETDPIYSANTYAVAMDQDVATTSDVTFDEVAVSTSVTINSATLPLSIAPNTTYWDNSISLIEAGSDSGVIIDGTPLGLYWSNCDVGNCRFEFRTRDASYQNLAVGYLWATTLYGNVTGTQGYFGNNSTGSAVEAVQGNAAGFAVKASGGKNYFQNNVGIGTTAPSYKLEVDSSTTDNVARFISSDDLAQIRVTDNDTTTYVGAKDSRAFIGLTSGLSTSNVSIDSNGNVGIGTSATSSKLDVFDGNTMLRRSASADGNGYSSYWYNGDGNYWRTYTAGNETFIFDYNGSTEMYMNQTDLRFGYSSSYPIGFRANSNTEAAANVMRTDTGGNLILDGLSNIVMNVDSNSDGSNKFSILNGGGTEIFTVLEADGNVGIGTSAPTSILTLASSGATQETLNAYSSTAANAPVVALHRSRSDTVGTHTIVQSGDAIGYIPFRGSNGSDWKDIASIRAYVDGTPGAGNDMPGRLSFYTTPDGSATVSERLRIDNQGNVGVGHTNPSSKLYVSGTTTSTGYATTAGYTGQDATLFVQDAVTYDIFKLTFSAGLLVGADNLSCFLPGTPILMYDGTYKNIEDVKIGEYVMSFDFDQNILIPQKVQGLEAPVRDHYYTVQFDDDTYLEVTDEHPMYVVGKGWASLNPEKSRIENKLLEVSLLELGDYVKTYDGQKQIVGWLKTEGAVQTYNLKNIAITKVFFAGDVLVHNKCLIGNALIDMADGSKKKIKDIKVGDLTTGGQVTKKFVKEMLEPIDGKILNNGTIATNNHVLDIGKVEDLDLPKVKIIDKVYDISTTTGYYYIDGIKSKGDN